MSGPYSHVTYFRTGDGEAVARAIIDLMMAESFELGAPPEPQPHRIVPLRESWHAIVLLPGREGWTLAQSLPLNLLAGRYAKRPRLTRLCRALRCDGFHVAHIGGAETNLVECQATGRYRISGLPPEPNGLVFGERVSREDWEESFQLLDLPGIERGDEADPEEIYHLFALSEYQWHEEAPDEELLSSTERIGFEDVLPHLVLGLGKIVNVAGARTMYFRPRRLARSGS